MVVYPTASVLSLNQNLQSKKRFVISACMIIGMNVLVLQFDLIVTCLLIISGFKLPLNVLHQQNIITTTTSVDFKKSSQCFQKLAVIVRWFCFQDQ